MANTDLCGTITFQGERSERLMNALDDALVRATEAEAMALNLALEAEHSNEIDPGQEQAFNMIERLFELHQGKGVGGAMKTLRDALMTDDSAVDAFLNDAEIQQRFIDRAAARKASKFEHEVAAD